jgi:membrane protein implicated in regulation of membrane protease activity
VNKDNVHKKVFGRRSEEKIPFRVIVKYILLQLPAVFILAVILAWLYYFSVVSLVALVFVLALWLLKDFILFFYVWPAYDIPKTIPVTDSATAIEDLNPDGYVQVDGELWRATVSGSYKKVIKGQQVKITGHKGLTLLVQGDEIGE